jgi:hypothetical protein
MPKARNIAKLSTFTACDIKLVCVFVLIAPILLQPRIFEVMFKSLQFGLDGVSKSAQIFSSPSYTGTDFQLVLLGQLQ